VGKNGQIRKRIAGQQRVIRQHEDKIIEELQKGHARYPLDP
jgi:hypothetical protein